MTRSATKKPDAWTVEVTLPGWVAEQVEEDAERAGQTLDEWLAEAARRHLADASDRAILREHKMMLRKQALKEFEAECGPISDEEMLERTKEWLD